MTNSIHFSIYPPFLFSLVFPAMIKLFKRSTSTHTCHHHHHFHHPLMGLGLATGDLQSPPNVLQSAMLRPNNAPPSKTRLNIESLDDVVCAVRGMASCTESLGFESSDEIHSNGNCDDDDVVDGDEIWRRRTIKAEGRGKMRSFPPPLSSLNRNGKPSFYLRPVRKDGRLELREVRIERPEILHASRHNGRLTLRLVSDLEEEEFEEEVEEEEVEEVEEIEEVEEEEEEEEIGEEKEEEEEKVEEWRFRGVGGSEGLRRCHEMVKHHHDHVHGNMRMCGISIV